MKAYCGTVGVTIYSNGCTDVIYQDLEIKQYNFHEVERIMMEFTDDFCDNQDPAHLVFDPHRHEFFALTEAGVVKHSLKIEEISMVPDAVQIRAVEKVRDYLKR